MREDIKHMEVDTSQQLTQIKNNLGVFNVYEMLTEVWISSVDLMDDDELESISEQKTLGIYHYVFSKYLKKTGKNSAIPDKCFEDYSQNLMQVAQSDNPKNYVVSKKQFFELTF